MFICVHLWLERFRGSCSEADLSRLQIAMSSCYASSSSVERKDSVGREPGCSDHNALATGVDMLDGEGPRGKVVDDRRSVKSIDPLRYVAYLRIMVWHPMSEARTKARASSEKRR
jgi:hypothetical protein